ncbi:hypothetical protein [Devosia sp. 2618]|uniref:hypothetical protein n=1 Tax=Devosia sp. 2618 TaxID=3156454 RepID=UPI0033967EB4
MAKLTPDQRELLRFIDHEDEGRMPGSKRDYAALLAARYIYEWEDGDYQMHVRSTPAGRTALTKEKQDG